MLLLMAARMPIGLSLLFVGGAGYAWLGGWPTFLNYIKATPYHDFSNYTLSVIPLFILMGALAEKSGLSTSLFRAASSLVGHRPGGLAMGLIAACTASARSADRPWPPRRPSRAPRCRNSSATATTRASPPAPSRSAARSAS